jgi:hypothetical protein
MHLGGKTRGSLRAAEPIEYSAAESTAIAIGRPTNRSGRRGCSRRADYGCLASRRVIMAERVTGAKHEYVEKMVANSLHLEYDALEALRELQDGACELDVDDPIWSELEELQLVERRGVRFPLLVAHDARPALQDRLAAGEGIPAPARSDGAAGGRLG